ncbi:MAG TPA: hypothetical protein VGW34_07870 [Allosphingosinicella sp.]|nr:hypothetical protein [Allosphingosinicella sp.]
MNGGGLGYDRYQVEGAYEWLMRIGDASAPPVLVLPPMFEEMNRTRALLAGIMRRLAMRGFSCWLPDLPGTGESERPLETCDWNDWRAAARAAAAHIGRRPALFSMRGGCLIDDAVDAACTVRFAPAAGASLARDLARAGLVSSGGTAGYGLGDGLSSGLRAATVQAVPALHVVRLTTDPAEADARLDGPALWRRSEPQNSPELCSAIAEQVEQWVRQCGAC